MAEPVYQVEGARELRASLKKAGSDLEDLRDVHSQVASYVGGTAAGMAPRQSGMLAASWRPGSAKTNATVRFGGAAVPYANAVHWGTGARPGRRGPHNISPNRFATDAAARTEPTWVPWYFAALERIVEGIRGQ